MLERNRLVVQMDKVAQARMQNNGHFVVRFELDEQRFSQLSKKLEQILQGFEGYRNRAVERTRFRASLAFDTLAL